MNATRNPLVSIIVTTRNEQKNIETCLKSLTTQTYKNIEVIVVDNSSTDRTQNIARKYTKNVLNKGPERSAQRNYGVKKSKGKYVLILDADMKVSPHVVSKSVEKIEYENVGGIIIPEKSYGIGYWAKVKELERSFYVNNDLIEAARFFKKNVFLDLNGFDENITGPEDWDFSQRVKEKYGIARIKSFIYHNEGKLTFWRSVSKKYYYAKKIRLYRDKSINLNTARAQLSLINRYGIFFQKPRKLFKNPLLGVGVILLKTLEFLAGGLGYINSKYVKS